jgi:hypothetical protein
VQNANSAALALQSGASNVSRPVQILSPGDRGAVSQQNNVAATSSAANVNETLQAAGQTQVGSGTGVQSIGQMAENAQAATSAAIAGQVGAENLSAPVAVLSDGGAGSLAQSNTTGATSSAGNANALQEVSGQTQAG